jgi:hypothetical protein
MYYTGAAETAIYGMACTAWFDGDHFNCVGCAAAFVAAIFTSPTKDSSLPRNFFPLCCSDPVLFIFLF